MLLVLLDRWRESLLDASSFVIVIDFLVLSKRCILVCAAFMARGIDDQENLDASTASFSSA